MKFQVKKSLKIAIVTNNYKPYSGGVVSSIDSFFSNLKELGHRPFIITLDFLGENIVFKQDVFRIHCPIRFIYKKNHMAIPFRAEYQILSIIKEKSPDLIHSQHPFMLGSFALNVGKQLDIPTIFTYHTQYENYSHYIPFPEIFTKPIIKRLVRSYCEEVQGVVFPSASIAKIENCYKIKSSSIIPSGILPLFFSDELIVKKNKIFELLTVSRFTKEKNILFLLDMFSLLNQEDFIFKLIGYGSELFFLKTYAYEKLKLSKEKVIFIEKPSKENLAVFYKKADLFVFSSKTETQGLVLAEAMAGGCPVVALNAPGSCDIVINNFNGFLVESMNDMILKINYLKSDSNQCLQMQKNARFSAKDYNSKNLTLKLIEFYNRILENSVKGEKNE